MVGSWVDAMVVSMAASLVGSSVEMMGVRSVAMKAAEMAFWSADTSADY